MFVFSSYDSMGNFKRNMENTSLKVGVNLGGWISQYPALDYDYFDTFIIRDDLRRIADWGMDHVRLPVDYPILQEDVNPGTYLDRGFEYIEQCLDWCEENRLRMILDLHKAPGYSFNTLDRNTLFGSAPLQDRYLAMWEEITRRFLGRANDDLAFELLNEIVLPNSDPWNSLVQRVVARIRSIDTGRLIVLGGNHYNAPDELDNLNVLDDANLLYTFHFYSPLIVTHQNAPWVPALGNYGHPVAYPGEAYELAAYLEEHPEYREWLGSEAGARYDRQYLDHVLAPAVNFSRRIAQPVYCGEFGVYDRVDIKTRINWTRDFVALLNSNMIGHAIWNYKALDFGLVDGEGKIVNQELIDIACQRF